MAYPQTDAHTLKMSFEDFLKYDEHTCAEWVNGEVMPMSPASDRHQNLSGFLESILRIYVESKNLGLIRSAPYLMRLNAHTAREPNLLFLSKDHQNRLLPTYLDGPADLAIEIISQEGIYHSKILPNFQLQESWLWQNPLPNILDVLKYLNIV